MTRHLATVQTISSVRGVEHLDNLELATISGWEVLVPTGRFREGQRVVYFEPDSLTPNNYGVPLKKDPASGLFHVTSSTVRGVNTAGLVVSLEDAHVNENTPTNVNISGQLHVIKYTSPLELAANAGDVIGPYQTRFAPKTDATRIQNFASLYPEIARMTWEATVKADGTSRTVVNDRETIRYFTRNKEIKPTPVLIDASPINEIKDMGDGWCVQFELCGPKIQGNPLNLTHPTGFVFAVTYRGEYVPKKKWGERFEHVVKDVEWEWPNTVEEAIHRVDGINSHYTEGRMDEGIVFYLANGQDRPHWLDATRRIKIINPSYHP